jgi:hypothetical protein
MIFLLRLKFYRIPFHEKLPKDNQFYRHYVQDLNATRMKESTGTVIDRDGTLFRGAIEIMERNHLSAKKAFCRSCEKSMSPIKKYKGN